MSGTVAVDTIAAIATPRGTGGVGMVRVSGPLAATIAVKIAGPLPAPRLATYRGFRDPAGDLLDRGLLVWFPGPASYTGEDVVEFQAHGSPILLELIQRTTCIFGARPARPGEFTERAFLNERLDLAQAEAVADLIEAGSEAALRAATRTLEGQFSERVGRLVDGVVRLRAQVEAGLDFSEEDDVPPTAWASTQSERAAMQAQLMALHREAAEGRRLRDGLTVAIAGQPNVGKSTLLNRWARVEAAIVSPLAGTTRDVLREHLNLDGLPVTVIDTAGLRDTEDPVEQEGVRRAHAVIAQAEIIVYVIDDAIGLTDADRAYLQTFPDAVPRLLLRNKCDLSGAEAGHRSNDGAWRIAAISGAGLDAVTVELHRLAGLPAGAQASAFTARARHLEALRRAAEHLRAAAPYRATEAELFAEELRQTQLALDEITGRFSSDDLLGTIFSRFCIGK